MKRIIITLAALTMAVQSFAQGNVLSELMNAAKQNGVTAENLGAESQSLDASAAAKAGGMGALGAFSFRRPAGSGFIVGINSSSSTFEGIEHENINQFHAGLTSKIPLFLGFSLQPAIMYNMKSTVVKDDITNSTIDTSVGYLEVPVQVQWGIQVKKLRPYVFAEPFLGYALNAKSLVKDYIDKGGSAGIIEDIAGGAWDDVDPEEVSNDIISRIEYGLGAGAGIELGHFQLLGRYFWNLGNIYQNGQLENVQEAVSNAIKDRKTFNGVSVSLVYLF